MSNSRRIFLKKTEITSMAVLAGSSAISNEKIMSRPSPGGRPDREANVTLDACIIDEIHNGAIGIPYKGNCILKQCQR